MTASAALRLLYVQDADPGFLWANGRIVPSAETKRRDLIFEALDRTAREARVDRQTPSGRVIWGRVALAVETPLHGTDPADRSLLVTMAFLGDTRTSAWHGEAVDLAVTELAAHGLQADRTTLTELLSEAQRLRPTPPLGWWLDAWHFFVRVLRAVRSRLALALTPLPGSPDPTVNQEDQNAP